MSNNISENSTVFMQMTSSGPDFPSSSEQQSLQWKHVVYTPGIDSDSVLAH